MTTLRSIQIVGRIVIGLLWAALLAFILAWVFHWPLPAGIEPEPITVLLSTISPTLTALFAWVENRFKKQQAELEEERYSISHALAYGYVHNYLDPAATHLLETHSGTGTPPPPLYIYLPEDLEELEPAAVQRTLARLRAKGYSTKPVQLELKDARPRDVLTVMKDGVQPAYFDFPNTLLTLRSLVAYKLASHPGAYDDHARDELARTYIRKFRQEVDRLITRKGLKEQVRFTDRNLAFLEAA